jgi:hypothetical protein
MLRILANSPFIARKTRFHETLQLRKRLSTDSLRGAAETCRVVITPLNPMKDTKSTDPVQSDGAGDCMNGISNDSATRRI